MILILNQIRPPIRIRPLFLTRVKHPNLILNQIRPPLPFLGLYKIVKVTIVPKLLHKFHPLATMAAAVVIVAVIVAVTAAGKPAATPVVTEIKVPESN